MKLVISESEKNHILGLYGLLEQQAIQNNPDQKIIPTNLGKYSGYKPTQQDLKIFNYPQGFPNLKAKDRRDWIEKAAIYLGYQLELIKSQKGWGSQPCNACSTTISGSLSKDIKNNKICLNSNLLAKTWKCPQGYSFYSVMARDYNTVDYTKMYNLVKTTPKAKDEIDRFVETIKKEGWDYVFRSIREAMTSGVGAASQVIIDLFGGGIAVEIVWGILLSWDVYQASKGNFDIINILTDLAGVITFGPGGKYIWGLFERIPISKTATLQELSLWVKRNPEVMKYFSKFNFESVLKNTIGKVVSFLEKLPIFGELIIGLKNFYLKAISYLEVLSGKTAVKAAEKGVEKYSTKEVSKAIEKKSTNLANNVTPGLGTAVKVFDKTSKLAKAISPS